MFPLGISQTLLYSLWSTTTHQELVSFAPVKQDPPPASCPSRIRSISPTKLEDVYFMFISKYSFPRGVFRRHLLIYSFVSLLSLILVSSAPRIGLSNTVQGIHFHQTQINTFFGISMSQISNRIYLHSLKSEFVPCSICISSIQQLSSRGYQIIDLICSQPIVKWTRGQYSPLIF